MFDWRNFITLAQELISHDTTFKEALYRTVISRCYYGVFKQVEDCLGSFNVSLPDRDRRGRSLGSHEKRIYFLQTYPNPEVRRFGDKLKDLKRQRMKADYKANTNVNSREMRRVLQNALELSDRWTNTIRGIIQP